MPFLKMVGWRSRHREARAWHCTRLHHRAILDILTLEENPTPEGAVQLRRTKADYRIYLHRSLYRAVDRIANSQRKVIVLRVGPRGGGVYRGYERW